MARVNVYLPDDLAEQARDAGINVSSITQDALRRELSGRNTSAWLAQVRTLRPAGASHEEAIAALYEVRDDMGERGG
jgi:post-segregation antitoxin (ccd killing protein)